jgi:hypothetical protein
MQEDGHASELPVPVGVLDETHLNRRLVEVARTDNVDTVPSQNDGHGVVGIETLVAIDVDVGPDWDTAEDMLETEGRHVQSKGVIAAELRFDLDIVGH